MPAHRGEGTGAQSEVHKRIVVDVTIGEKMNVEQTKMKFRSGKQEESKLGVVSD